MRLRPNHLLLLDLVSGLGYAVLGWALFSHDAGQRAVAVLGTLLAATAVALARRRPVAAFVAALSTFALAPVASELSWVAVLPMTYVLWRAAADCPPRIAGALLTASMAGAAATALPGWQHVGAVVPFALVFIAAWAIGYAIGQRRRYREALARLSRADGRSRVGACPPRRCRGATADRARAPRCRRAQHERDHRAGRLRPPRRHRRAGQGARGARGDRDHRPQGPRRDAPTARRAARRHAIRPGWCRAAPRAEPCRARPADRGHRSCRSARRADRDGGATQPRGRSRALRLPDRAGGAHERGHACRHIDRASIDPLPHRRGGHRGDRRRQRSPGRRRRRAWPGRDARTAELCHGTIDAGPLPHSGFQVTARIPVGASA